MSFSAAARGPVKIYAQISLQTPSKWGQPAIETFSKVASKCFILRSEKTHAARAILCFNVSRRRERFYKLAFAVTSQTYCFCSRECRILNSTVKTAIALVYWCLSKQRILEKYNPLQTSSIIGTEKSDVLGGKRNNCNEVSKRSVYACLAYLRELNWNSIDSSYLPVKTEA